MSVSSIESKILNALLDQYEKSKTFSGENKVFQTFKASVAKLFPKYADSAEYDFYVDVNAHLSALEKKNFITLQKEKSGKIKNAALNTDGKVLAEIYAYLHRTPRKEMQADLLSVIESYSDGTDSLLQSFLAEQKSRIKKNKNAEHFKSDIKEFSDVLCGVKEVIANEDEIFIRDFSARLYGDSKRFEKLESAVISILTDYGDYDDKETVLSEYGIVKTPTYVCVKGNGQITVGTQKIDFSGLNGDIAFSTQSLKEITDVEVYGDRVVTVENLTSFHDYKNDSDFVIYLGGFHNRVKRDFILLVHNQNQQKGYLHFGDIDAGGFYILNHLRKRTGIQFCPLYMDIPTLQKYEMQTKPLTVEDKKRLERMMQQVDFFPYAPTIRYMLEKGCKLEQENVRVPEQSKMISLVKEK